MHGRHDGVVGLPLVGWRTGDDALHAGHLGCDHAHVSRSHHGVTAAGDIAADAADRYVFVAQRDARQCLYLNIAQRPALNFGEVTHLLLGEADIAQGLLGDPVDAGLYLSIA